MSERTHYLYLAQHEINESLRSINFKEILCDFDKNIKPTDDKLGN